MFCFVLFLNLSLCKLHGTLHSEVLSEVSCSGVTGGRGEDRVPPDTSDWEISADLPGKRGKEKENGAEKKENRKREGGKLKMEGDTFQNN